MALYAEMTVSVVTKTDSAVNCIFHEDTSNEVELWVPLSVIEDVEALEDEDDDANVTIGIKKWFLKNNEIDYE